MKASFAALAFASWSLCACAEGYGTAEIGRRDNAALAPSPELDAAMPVGGAGGAMTTGGVGGEMPAGEPCLELDVIACPCEGSTAQGQRMCFFDMASPTQGFFGPCTGCPPPTPPDDPALQCSDGMHGGAETSIDCGGPNCPPCPLGSACRSDSDCAEGVCLSSACTVPETSGAGGAAGSGGTGGTSGEGGSGGVEEPPPEEPPPDEPVEDCDGYPEGTECDRDCILPSNTARCTSRGTCSCLG